MTRGMWVTMGLALFVGGVALSIGPAGEARAEGAPRTTDVALLQYTGVLLFVLAAFILLRAWHRVGWGFGYWGAAIGFVGIVATAAALDPTCECGEGVYMGIALAVIGAGAVLGRAFFHSRIDRR